MSASQTPSPGRTPNGTAASHARRRRPANPLVRPRKPQPGRPTPTSINTTANGNPTTKGSGQPSTSSSQSKTQSDLSTADQGPYEDIPVVVTKRAVLEGFRHHVMRFLPNVSATFGHVDPTDEQQFTRPVRLHRRNPKAPPSAQWGREMSPSGSGHDTKMNIIDDKEKERREMQKAQRQAEREANQAQIAPVAKADAPPKKKQIQKKTEQVYQASEFSGKKQDLQLRYEESLPWHLEDDDNKTWMGTYEAALSNCHVLLMPENNAGKNQYRMIPLEKWYKFTPRNQFKALSIEEAEARMGKKVKDPRWFMETQMQSVRQRKEEAERQASGRLFTRKGERGENAFKEEGDDEKPEAAVDADDIDYNYEEAFADDEENALFGGDDDEAKEAEDKIKREQREANVFELKENKDFDLEEEEERRKASEEKKLSKRTKKFLLRHEKNYDYEDDSDGNPYTSESESEDSEMERIKEEEGQKTEDQAKPNDDKAAAAEKIPSGASSKGNNTPSGRPKHSDPLKKSLKRPGSPNLSEVSGSESARKKIKKKHGMSQQLSDTGTGRNTPISRPSSPSNASVDATSGPLVERRNSSLKLNVDSSQAGAKTRKISFMSSKAGSGSEAEKSDASKPAKKPRLHGSQPTSPNASRAGSPGIASVAASAPRKSQLPSPEEIRALVPVEGIALAELIKKFKTAVKDPGFIPLVKANSRWHKETKTLFPKDSRPGATATQSSGSTLKNDGAHTPK